MGTIVPQVSRDCSHLESERRTCRSFLQDPPPRPQYPVNDGESPELVHVIGADSEPIKIPPHGHTAWEPGRPAVAVDPGAWTVPRESQFRMLLHTVPVTCMLGDSVAERKTVPSAPEQLCDLVGV